MVTEEGILTDLKLIAYLNHALDFDAASMLAGLKIGTQLAVFHPEWVQAFLMVTATPDARGVVDELVREMPITHITELEQV